MGPDTDKKVGDGWVSSKWKVVKASPNNHNPLIDDILKPVYEELKEVLKIELKALDRRIRRK